MAEAVVTFVLEQLGQLLIDSVIQEVIFLQGVRDQVDQAKKELRRMRCFLKDADARARGGDERVRNWVAEIREAAYDLEDAILSSLSEEVPREGRFRRVIKRLACLYCHGVELHRIGSKIENISTDISALTTSLQTYGVTQLESSGPSASNERLRELRRAYSHVVDCDTVGLDEDIKKLVACLTQERTPNCRAVSICGMGGLGKTTLARKVYQHSQILTHFDSVAWVSISQQCQVGSVWKQVLGKVWPEGKDDIRRMDENEICRKLSEILLSPNKKCLIVLDDIWTDDMWVRLSPAFPKDATNSKILLTTRNKDLLADENRIVHEPRCLDDEESWELFAKVFTVSQTNLEDEKKKKEIGKEMLKHCGGLPLAITVLRGILSRKQSVFEWEAMQKNSTTYINQGKAVELRGASETVGVSWILGLSYDELPYQMKPCFLHLANFPEDHEIRVRELCKIWMAEGFVSSEDTGYEILHELVQRCMVLTGALSSIGGGRIKTCLLHDLMRDLCLSKAREENFLQILNSGNSSQEEIKVRRLAVLVVNETQVVDANKLLSIVIGDCLRSFICFGPFPSSEMRSPLFNRFHMLRVLKLEACNKELCLPEETGKISHLRFLSLKGSWVDPLPSSINKLKYLQTLDLRVALGFDKLLENVTNWRLDRIRHLYLPLDLPGRSCNELLLENASDAQTLVGIQTSYTGLSHFSQLTNLTKLTLCYDQPWQGGVAFNKLRSLVIINSIHEEADPSSAISSCPRINKLAVYGVMKELNQFTTELVKLTLYDTYLNYDPMPTLEKLPKLRILTLSRSIMSSVKMVCSRGGFPRLVSLHLKEKWIREWHVEEGAFPSLCHLTLEGCNQLKTVPDGLRHLLKTHSQSSVQPSNQATMGIRQRKGNQATMESPPTVNVCSKDPEFVMAIRNGCVTLVRVNPADDSQKWYKDDKYSTRFKDDEGFPCFSLINKSTGQAIKHAVSAQSPVELIVPKHEGNGIDESILWTQGRDLGDGFGAIRMLTNIHRNMDAFVGYRPLREGCIIGLWDWNDGDNQKWKIQYTD